MAGRVGCHGGGWCRGHNPGGWDFRRGSGHVGGGGREGWGRGCCWGFGSAPRGDVGSGFGPGSAAGPPGNGACGFGWRVNFVDGRGGGRCGGGGRGGGAGGNGGFGFAFGRGRGGGGRGWNGGGFGFGPFGGVGGGRAGGTGFADPPPPPGGGGA